MYVTDQKKRVKAARELEFIRNHPAFSTDILHDSLFDGAWFYMAECCIRGIDKCAKNILTVWRGDKNWKRFEKRFEEEYKGDSSLKNLQSVSVTYEELYGEPWKFHHVEYWYETAFFVYEGDPYNRMACFERENWDSYVGPSGGAKTFEDMVIRCASKIRRTYGSFNCARDFITEAEKENQKHERFAKDGIEYKNFALNKNRVELTSGLKNLRWLEWFMGTDYCKKHWKDYDEKFNNLVQNSKNMPEDRELKLKKYTTTK